LKTVGGGRGNVSGLHANGVVSKRNADYTGGTKSKTNQRLGVVEIESIVLPGMEGGKR